MHTQLWEQRKKTGLSQEDVARRAGITLRTYQYIEHGQREPSVSNAQRIAQILGSTVNELFPLPAAKTSRA